MDVDEQNVKRLLLQQGHGLDPVARLLDLRLGQALADLVDQLHPGIFFVVDHGDAHGTSLLCIEIPVRAGGDRGREKETVEPEGVLWMEKGQWSP